MNSRQTARYALAGGRPNAQQTQVTTHNTTHSASIRARACRRFTTHATQRNAAQLRKGSATQSDNATNRSTYVSR